MNCQNPSPGRPSARLPLSLPVLCAVADNARQKAICHPRSRGPLGARAATGRPPPLPAPSRTAVARAGPPGPGRRGPPAASARYRLRRGLRAGPQARSVPAALGEVAALGVVAQLAALVHGAHDAVDEVSGSRQRRAAQPGEVLRPRLLLAVRPVLLLQALRSVEARGGAFGGLVQDRPKLRRSPYQGDNTWTI